MMVEELITLEVSEKQMHRLTHDFMGRPYKASIETRLKNSKFAKHIGSMEDKEIKLLMSVIGASSKTLEAIRQYLNAPDGVIQKYALIKEIEKRNIAKVVYPRKRLQ